MSVSVELEPECKVALTAALDVAKQFGLTRPVFETAKQAKVCLDYVNQQLIQNASNTPWPQWATEAVKNGWKPPKGWKP